MQLNLLIVCHFPLETKCGPMKSNGICIQSAITLSDRARAGDLPRRYQTHQNINPEEGGGEMTTEDDVYLHPSNKSGCFVPVFEQRCRGVGAMAAARPRVRLGGHAGEVRWVGVGEEQQAAGPC